MSEDNNLHEGDTEVHFTCNIQALRTLHDCVEKCLKTWPGGHPHEQVDLEALRKELYIARYSALMDNNLL